MRGEWNGGQGMERRGKGSKICATFLRRRKGTDPTTVPTVIQVLHDEGKEESRRYELEKVEGGEEGTAFRIGLTQTFSMMIEKICPTSETTLSFKVPSI